MNKICTSVEQSQKLLELGISADTANMCYRIVAYNPNDTHVYQPYCFVGTLESDIPAWSLSALLYLLDNPQLFNHDDNWKCDGYTIIGYWHDNAIDAVFEVVELEAEKFQKGAKRHGIRRNVIKNIEEL